MFFVHGMSLLFAYVANNADINVIGSLLLTVFWMCKLPFVMGFHCLERKRQLSLFGHGDSSFPHLFSLLFICFNTLFAHLQELAMRILTSVVKASTMHIREYEMGNLPNAIQEANVL